MTTRPVTEAHYTAAISALNAADTHRYALVAGQLATIPHTILARVTPFWPGYPLDAFPYIPRPDRPPVLLWPQAILPAPHLHYTFAEHAALPPLIAAPHKPKALKQQLETATDITSAPPELHTKPPRDGEHTPILRIGTYFSHPALFLVPSASAPAPPPILLVFPSPEVLRTTNIPYRSWADAPFASILPLTPDNPLEATR